MQIHRFERPRYNPPMFGHKRSLATGCTEVDGEDVAGVGGGVGRCGHGVVLMRINRSPSYAGGAVLEIAKADEQGAHRGHVFGREWLHTVGT
jgi:hypothetical protein